LIFREVEDRDLILQTRKGKVEAYNLLVSRWEKRIYNYVLRLVRNREDALDLTQDVFMKAYQNVNKLDDLERFGPWLFRIAHNETFSLMRRQRPDRVELNEAIAEDPGSSPFESGGGRLLPLELSIAVTAAMTRLKPEQREAVMLKVFEGFKFEEIAEILETPVSTVKSRLYTAFDQLKDVLAPMSKSAGKTV
jgi:RNA polymerase sigma-70 factor (ECF subfamily)